MNKHIWFVIPFIISFIFFFGNRDMGDIIIYSLGFTLSVLIISYLSTLIYKKAENKAIGAPIAILLFLVVGFISIIYYVNLKCSGGRSGFCGVIIFPLGFLWLVEGVMFLHALDIVKKS